MGFSVRKWVEKQRLNHSLQIACSTCTIERNTAPVSMEARLKPFLVIQTLPLPQRYRPRRNANCQPDMKECCRDELYISFAEIGWSDWILHPSGYHAYFCRGSCSTAVSLTMSGTHHNDVIRVSISQFSVCKIIKLSIQSSLYVKNKKYMKMLRIGSSFCLGFSIKIFHINTNAPWR